MPRKRTSGSSPEKPVATTTRRNTRRGRNKSEEPEAEIPKHLLRGSDESGSNESDNDSDYGSPKKGRGRGKTIGRGKKAKEPTVENAPTPRPRRGRRGATAKELSPDNVTTDDRDNSQSTQELTEASESTQPEPEGKPREPEPENADNLVNELEPLSSVVTTAHDNIEEKGKVSEVNIEQENQSNNDRAPVNEEVDESKDKDDTGHEGLVKELKSGVVVGEKVEAPVDEELSKDEPESSVAQSDSRFNSPEKEELVETKQRARSSSGEIREIIDSAEVKNAPASPAISEIKKIEPEKMTVQRKRKWTARKTDDQPVIAITTDSLKNIISEEIKPVPLSDVKLNLSPEPEPDEKRARTKFNADDKDAKKKLLKERLRKQEEEELRRNEFLVKAIDKPANGAASNGNTLLKDRKVSIIVDDPAAPSPPKNDSSNILFISNLVRPFTVLQLKGLLARTGKIVENGFWIDKIKSKCYVKYETEE